MPICVAPVIDNVAAKALSLSDVQITITLNETGGQPEESTVSHYIDLNGKWCFVM